MHKKIINFYKFIFWSPEKIARQKGVKIGSNCDIQTKYFGSEPYLIEIGDHVQITKDVRFLTHGGGWIFRDKKPNFDTFGKIKIGNNVYIGNCSLILPGVKVGNNVIIGAGSVVTKSIPDNVVIGGNPAKIIRSISDLEKKLESYNLDLKCINEKDKKKEILKRPDNNFIEKKYLY